MNFEHPLTQLVWLTSLVSIGLTFGVSYLLIGQGDSTLPYGLWWKLSAIISCGTLAGAIIPELVKVFTSVNSGHVREVVTASKEGGPSLNILAGLTAGNFSGLLDGSRHRGAHGHRVLDSTLGRHREPARRLEHGRRPPDGRRRSRRGRVRVPRRQRGVRVRSRRVRLPRHGPGHDRGRLVRSGDGQRAVGLRALAHRDARRHRRGDREGVQVQARLREGQDVPRGERRRGQHVQGDREAGAHRHRRRRRGDDDLRAHHARHERPPGRPRSATSR